MSIDTPTTTSPVENTIEKYVFSGSDLFRATKCGRYKLTKDTMQLNPLVVSRAVANDVYSGSRCNIHGSTCCGHIQIDEKTSTLCIPCTMSGGTPDRQSNYDYEKDRLLQRAITPNEYKEAIRQFMMGKKGAVRSMNAACIEGSAKMVISIGTYGDEGCVTIPEFVAESMLVPDLSKRYVKYRPVSDGDYCILVRQPCLWSGGIQPARIKVSTHKHVITDDGHWNINSSMRIPPGMCTPYGADFDGDEMTIFPVTRPESIEECKRFMWNYTKPDFDSMYDSVVPASTESVQDPFDRLSKCTTTSWRDANRNFKVTDAHKMVGLNLSAYLNYKGMCTSTESFIEGGNTFMNSGALKSSLQSDIGALSRRAKLGAEIIELTQKGVPCLATSSVNIIQVRPEIFESIKEHPTAWFGNPGVRAMSKLTSGVMQITLKVKSLTSISSATSPLMSLLVGSSLCFGITTDNVLKVVECKKRIPWGKFVTVCNMYAIQSCPVEKVEDAIVMFVSMAVNECNKPFDHAEISCLVMLVRFLCTKVKSEKEGIEIKTMGLYEYIKPANRMNACYFDMKRNYSTGFFETPTSTFERLFLANVSSLKSIDS